MMNMIQNDRELAITQKHVGDFKRALQEMDTDPAHKSLSEKKQRVYREALEGEVEVLNEQIRAYNKTFDDSFCSANIE
jgi:phage host-nuclease inhibitor protein Gam